MQNQRTVAVVLFAYATPLLIYFFVFGPTLSKDHSDWAEFGSAMAGIYAPIVALTTLAVLVRQVRLQFQQTRLQDQINNHQYDQAYIVLARADIDFYAAKLAESLNKLALPGMNNREFLHRHFQAPSLTELNAPEHKVLAAELDATSPEILGMWEAIYPIFAGLESKEDAFYIMTLRSSMQKLKALLSYETCVCLENCYRVRTEGKLTVSYKFSSLCRGEPLKKNNPND